MANQIVIKGTPIKVEYKASGTPTPGHLLEMASATEAKVHASAGQPAEKFFALEDELQGRAYTTAYTAATQMQCGHFRPGDVVNALIANGETIAVGDELESNGNGELRKYTTDSAGAVEYPNSLVGVSLDAVDMSDSSAADPSGRCRVRIL